MKQQCQYIYRQMQADFHKCRERELMELQRIECCFRTASGFWLLVREELADYHFKTENKKLISLKT